MTGDELRRWRERHGYARKHMVLLLGCSKRQLRRWERDQLLIPSILERLLRLAGSSTDAMRQLQWLSLLPATGLEDRITQLLGRRA